MISALIDAVSAKLKPNHKEIIIQMQAEIDFLKNTNIRQEKDSAMLQSQLLICEQIRVEQEHKEEE